MRSLPKDRQIYISGRVWHEITPKFNLEPFIYAIHDGIDLSNYGEAIKKFYFTFIIVRPNNKLSRPAKQYFHKKKKAAEMSVEIPYEAFVNASEEEAVKLMEKAYLEGIDLLGTLPLEEDFDVDAFKRDVEKIFSQEKWYEMAEAA